MRGKKLQKGKNRSKRVTKVDIQEVIGSNALITPLKWVFSWATAVKTKETSRPVMRAGH